LSVCDGLRGCGAAHRYAPENTLAAFASALDKGATHVEVDVRTSLDGVLVVMHDQTVRRTTNGTGLVRAMTAAELVALDAGSWFSPAFADERVPLFADVLALVKARNGSCYIDYKEGNAATMYTTLVAAGMQYRGVLIGGQEMLLAMQALDPKVRIMPGASTAAQLESQLAVYGTLTAVNADDDIDDAALVPLARASGVDVFVNRFDRTDNVDGYRDAVDKGAAGVQCDDIGALTAFLRTYP
jgi:glycerophosphoryl diester phosphodiesterase